MAAIQKARRSKLINYLIAIEAKEKKEKIKTSACRCIAK